jgi:glycosyltransferase involved in cell wall biosynthesis
VEEACRTSGAELRKIERTHANALGPEEMREFYQDLDVLAVASDMDGTPNPALEAAACGVAVVSNRIGNMPEFITDGVNGRLVERTAPSIAAALRELAGDPHAVIRMGEAARAEIERAWTWRDLSRNYAAMWTAALTNQRSKAA